MVEDDEFENDTPSPKENPNHSYISSTTIKCKVVLIGESGKFLIKRGR